MFKQAFPQQEPTESPPLTPAPSPTPAPIMVHSEEAGASGWVFCGLPPKGMPDGKDGWLFGEDGTYLHRWVRCAGGIRVEARDLPMGRTKLAFGSVAQGGLTGAPFALHSSIDLQRALPRVWYEGQLSYVPALIYPGQPVPEGGDFLALIDQSAAHQTWHLRTRHPNEQLTHDVWFTMWSGSPTIDWVAHTVYGTTANNGQAQIKPLGQLWLVGGYPMRMDYATQNGLGEWTVQNADGTHAMPLARPMQLHRARRIENRGQILCGGASTNPPRLTAVWTGWDGHWLALGKVPEAPRNAAADLAAQRAAYDHPLPGSYEQPRPLCQPPWSNTTGEQVGFGASALGRIVTLHEPWMIHAMLWHTQSYAIRPTANKEPDGRPFAAARHPNAETMGMRPDLNWGQYDRIGWPPPGQLTWIDGYVCSDDEHRDDTTLAGMVALTNCPALRSILVDHVELGKTEIRSKLGWLPAPRAIGRLLLAWSNAAWLGIDGAESLIDRMVEMVSDLANRPPIPPVGDLIIGPIGEAKYGWNKPGGGPVMGWQPWQQAIAAIGLLAAHRAVGYRAGGNANALWQARGAAAAAVKHGFDDDTLEHVYAVSVDGNGVVKDGAASYWTAAAAYVLLRLAGLNPRPDYQALIPKAQRVLAAYRNPPSWMESQWWAI